MPDFKLIKPHGQEQNKVLIDVSICSTFYRDLTAPLHRANTKLAIASPTTTICHASHQ
jgi:hypothetical protein